MDVFVYGTLTDQEHVMQLLGPEEESAWEFVGSATIDGLHRVEGAYPTLLPGGRVTGRLLAVDEAGLDRIDRYEGVDQGLYVRVPVPRADGSGAVWTYIGDPDRLNVADEWPGEGPLSDRVRAQLDVADICCRT